MSLPQDIYWAINGEYYLKLNTLPEGEASQIEATLKNIKAELKQTGYMFASNNWWWNEACVGASDARGEVLATILPSNWSVTSYTHRTDWHTFNVIYFASYNNNTYYWRVDNYVAGIVLVDFLGISPPHYMYKTHNSRTLSGSRPFRK